MTVTRDIAYLRRLIDLSSDRATPNMIGEASPRRRHRDRAMSAETLQIDAGLRRHAMARRAASPRTGAALELVITQ